MTNEHKRLGARNRSVFNATLIYTGDFGATLRHVPDYSDRTDYLKIVQQYKADQEIAQRLAAFNPPHVTQATSIGRKK